MTEEERFVCTHCEKVIRYERPLFCPYCGEKLDPTAGLEAQFGEVEIYRWSAVAPLLIYLLMGWLVLLLPVSLLFGARGVIWISLGLALCVILSLGISVWIHKSRS